ncbi:MAG: metallophosphoesterase [Planctomycetaceae bacterium]|jgi:predicted phosphodiesterase|nr:metallophosphoesterase [Planctomycetaceae bacterium]
MKRAIISDIHSNLEAFEAVLADIDSQGIKEIYCLGDLVGYGPNPIECIDIIMKRAKICVLGNHDQATLFDPEGFNSGAERAIFWTRDQLENSSRVNEQLASSRWDFLGQLPRIHKEGDFVYVHGSPRNPLNEYVFQDDIYDERKMERLFSVVPKYSFQGHTHVPGVFTESREFFAPSDIDNRFTLAGKKAMINVGSVGQPRDRNPLACYVVLEDLTVNFRRVEYAIDVTMNKILAIPDLDHYLGERLKVGK